MPDYLWFHAFHRPTVEETLEVLRHGPRHNPNPNISTRLNEQELGIASPCVYAYLGRTQETFGSSAICLPLGDLIGTVSPFDTGGLIEYLEPVRSWQPDYRRGYLQHYSWPSTAIADLLERYPSLSPSRVRSYLAGDRPPEVGPHEVWVTSDPHLVATIWAGDDCRAWLWESRVPDHMPVNQNLVRWSCSSATYGEILRHIDHVTEVAEATWLEGLLQRYIVGGVSALVSELRAQQEAA